MLARNLQFMDFRHETKPGVLQAREIIFDGLVYALHGDSDTVSALDGSTTGYGYIHEYFGHANVLTSETDGVWAPVDNASWDEKTGAFSYDWLDGYMEY